MLDDATLLRFTAYAMAGLMTVMFMVGYVFLYWARRQTPERRARVVERLRRFSDQGLQLFVRFEIAWVVAMSVLLLVLVFGFIVADALGLTH